MPKCTYKQALEMAEKKVGKCVRSGEWQSECWIDGKFQFKVTIPDSHGSNTEQIKPGTLSSIRRQLRLTTDEFNRWRDCDMDEAEYKQLMRQLLSKST